uniref:Uncharacterized protein n=1 Tax=Picea sitchensis TaxID=3332 RepID=D5AAG0_PICSI|nr:unknown [Picea sitchensis]
MEAPGESTGNSKESGVKEERMKIIKQTRERFGRFFYRFPEGESSADISRESLWREIDMNRTRINRDNGSSDMKRKQRGNPVETKEYGR